MAATPVASVVRVAKKHCLPCNEVISTEAYDDVKKEGLNKLKELCERWAKKVEEIFCCDNPYKEFRYAHSRTKVHYYHSCFSFEDLSYKVLFKVKI